MRGLLKEITEGPAFKGSQRSGQFLSLSSSSPSPGTSISLKSGSSGSKLFKREPTYDTGEDAIVRVTASDVRKRLLQHYGWFGADVAFRIELPLDRISPASFQEARPRAQAQPPGRMGHASISSSLSREPSLCRWSQPHRQPW